MAPTSELVPTRLGRLYTERSGTGPPVVLWHSLFVDSRSWGPLVDTLTRYRTVITVDGPSHGRSDAVLRDFTFDECVSAAGQVLDRLGLSEPVDWVGNAWGGHVGFRLARGPRPRLRTLTTIGTPVQAVTAKEKWTKIWPLVQAYRLIGPADFLVNTLGDSLLGAQAIAAQPDRAAIVLDSFRGADRKAMFHAMRSMMLQRNGIAEILPDVAVPTLVMSVRDDVTGWRPNEARATCAAMKNCEVADVAGTGHISPLLLDIDTVERLILGFFRR